MDDKNTFDIHTFRAQKIIAQWIVDGFDFIHVFKDDNWAPCTDPDQGDGLTYIPFWYEYQPVAVNLLASFLEKNEYIGYKNGAWVK